MSNFDYNRIRNHTMSFRVSEEERRQLKARIMVTGLPIGRYIFESALHQKICIAVGKYQSDRLSIELRKLREQLAEKSKSSEELKELVTDCIYLLEQLMELITTDATTELQADDFRVVQREEVSQDIKNVPAENRDITE